MSEKSTPPKTPSELLAEKILSTLTDRSLILTEDTGKMQQKLAGGKLKPEDWRLLIEKALDKGESNG